MVDHTALNYKSQLQHYKNEHSNDRWFVIQNKQLLIIIDMASANGQYNRDASAQHFDFY